MLYEVITPLGYKVLLANCGEQALEIAASHQDKIDLLLTDVLLPGIKGQELARQIVTKCPEVNVLFMSVV